MFSKKPLSLEAAQLLVKRFFLTVFLMPAYVCMYVIYVCMYICYICMYVCMLETQLLSIVCMYICSNNRGMIDVNYVPGDGDDTLEDVRTDGPVLFCHDPRLQLSSLVYHTPEQVRLSYIHRYIHKCMHTYIHTHTYIHIHTYTNSLTFFSYFARNAGK